MGLENFENYGYIWGGIVIGILMVLVFMFCTELDIRRQEGVD